MSQVLLSSKFIENLESTRKRRICSYKGAECKSLAAKFIYYSYEDAMRGEDGNSSDANSVLHRQGPVPDLEANRKCPSINGILELVSFLVESVSPGRIFAIRMVGFP